MQNVYLNAQNRSLHLIYTSGRPGSRYRNINLKFGLQFSQNKPTFPLDLRAEALG